MKNPTTFAPTPFNRFKVNDKSHTGTHELTHNGTRDEQMTPWTHSGKVGKSATGRGELAHNGTRTEQKTSFTHFKPTPHSSPDVPVATKKWHKKGYDMTSPS